MLDFQLAQFGCRGLIVYLIWLWLALLWLADLQKSHPRVLAQAQIAKQQFANHLYSLGTA
jgi:hypothetical protein